MPHCVTSAAFYRERAWHGLGHIFNEVVSPQEIHRLAGALYPVDEEQIFRLHNGNYIPIPTHKALVNNEAGTDGALLEVMSTDYKVIPLVVMVQLGEALREHAIPISCVVMNDGRKVATTYELASLESEVVPGDPHRMRVTIVNSFDGSTAFIVLFSVIRVVCANTCGWAITNADRQTLNTPNRPSIIRIPHIGNAEAMIRRLPSIMDMANHSFTHSVEELEAMAAKPCDTELFRQILEQTFAADLARPINDERGNPDSERPRTLNDIPGVPMMMRHFNGDLIGNDIPGVQGTVYAAFNSITQFYNHEAYQNGKNGTARRLGGLMFGANSIRVLAARNAALQATRA